MKTLYISDLDGTLLDADARLSAYTEQTLTRLIGKGVAFTFASGRTPESALKIMEDVPLKLPVIMMNGVLIYDVEEKRYLLKEYLTEESVVAIKRLLKKYRAGGFLYKLTDDHLMTYYETLDSFPKQDFMEKRRERYNKPFTKVEDFDSLCVKDTFYFCLLEAKEVLDPLAEALKQVPDVGFAYYREVYYPGTWCLEIFSARASKYHAVKWLRDYLKPDEAVGFGDNLNDLPLFKACDRNYAVENAAEELRAAADGVIGSNIEDGVACFLERQYNYGLMSPRL